MALVTDAKDSTKGANRIGWLSVLQGGAMLLVVVGHSWLTAMDDPAHPWVSLVVRTIYHFHMPLFFAISGYLFWTTRLSRGVSWQINLQDKAARLLVPYAGFTLFALGLKFLLPGLMQRQAQMSWDYFARILVYPDENPLGELWFVATLFVLFQIGNGLEWLSRSPLRSIVVLVVAIGFQWKIGLPVSILNLGRAVEFFPSFFLGVALARHEVVSRMPVRWWAIPVCVVVGWLLEVFAVGQVHLAVVATGWILVSFWVARIIASRRPSLFASFREWTFQIFLMGIFFQMAVRVAYRRLDVGYPLFFALAVAAGLYGPVVVVWILRRYAPRGLLPIFGLTQSSSTTPVSRS